MIKTLILLIMIILISSCSKKLGSTTSKIKIVSGNIQALMGTKASNGLILYGKSADGKTFTEGITGDSVDLVFPNGVWNFYAISWEGERIQGRTLPDFNGKTYCGKLLSQNLNGTDVNLTLNLTNSNCDDADFSAHTKIMTLSDTSEVFFPKPNLFSCKDLTSVKNESAIAAKLLKCHQTETARFNKGYHTSYKIVAYKYKKFGASNETAPAKIFESACVQSYSGLPGGLEPSSLNSINNSKIPVSFGNGLSIAVEAYYSSLDSDENPNGCDPSRGFDIFPLTGNASTDFAFIDVDSVPSAYNFFMPSNEANVCKGPRLNDGSFASGNGSVGLPYTICTKEQLELLRSQFATYRTKSFDLLTDINYEMKKIDPIGDVLTNNGGDSDHPFEGSFDGRRHRISNFIIDCKLPKKVNTNPTANNQIGFFRTIQNATIKNIVLDRAVVICDQDSYNGGGNNLGGLVGEIQTTTASTFLENIKINGKISGNDSVGSIAGKIVGVFPIIATQLHAKGDVSGNQKVGGLFGSVTTTGPSSSSIDKVSFFGVINGIFSKERNLQTNHQDVGGIIGFAQGTQSNKLFLKKAIVKSERIEGSSNNGGFIGRAYDVSLSDSYVEANQVSNSVTGFMGGAIGSGTNVSLNNVFSANGMMITNNIVTTPPPINVGGLVGYFSEVTCLNSFFTGLSRGEDECGTLKTSALLKSKAIFNGASFNFNQTTGIWSMPDDGNDIPRLAFETEIENEVPYLKRECTGHYSSQTEIGTGTKSDPKWICDYAQFRNMATYPNLYYELKKNIFYEGSGYLPLPPGVYKLKGNQFGLYNFGLNMMSPTGPDYQQGIFSILNSGSLISDLKIFNANLTTLTTLAPTSGDFSVGILAGINKGDVRNISIYLSKATFYVPITTPTSNTFFGGIIGKNEGLVSKAILDMETSVSGSFYPSGFSLVGGGAFGLNTETGVIEAVESFASLSRSLCLSAAAPFPAQEILGTFAGGNTSSGIIKEVASHGKFIAKASVSTCTTLPGKGPNSNISTFVARNLATISDFLVDANFSFFLGGTNFSPAPEILAYNTGTVRRGFVMFQNSDANKIMTQRHTEVGSIPTCSITEIGKYFVDSTTDDITMCDGVSNVLLPYNSPLYSSIMTPKTDVFYLAEQLPYGNDASPKPGIYNNGSLIFSVPDLFKVEIYNGTTRTNIPLTSSWSVATDYLNPQGKTWMVDLWDDEVESNSIPSFVKLNFKPDDFGPPL